MTTDHGRSAAMPALASAAGRPLHPSGGGRRSRGGFAWFRSLFGLPAGAGRALRTALPGLLALLVAAAWTSGAQAQTASPAGLCEGQITEVTFSNIAENPSAIRITNTSFTSSQVWFVNTDGTNAGQNGFPVSAVNNSFTARIQLADNLVASSGAANIRVDGPQAYWHGIVLPIWDSADSRCAASTADGVTLSGSALTLTELGSSSDAEKTYTVVLDTDPGANVVVTVASGDTSAVAVDTDSSTAGDQDTLTFTTSNWNAAQTVTLRALNDGNAAAETVTISHAAAVTDTNNAYHQIPIDNVTATTVDAGHGVVVSKASVTVTAGGATADYTIRLKSQPGGSVVVTPTSSATASATVSGALTFTTGNWSTPQTVTVTGAGAGSATISHMVTTAATGYPTSTTIASVTAMVNAAANNAPTVANMIPDQTATVGTALSYAFPDNTFNDADNDDLTYSATKSDDTALPTWLTFTAGTRTFSGTPQAADVGTLSVKVTGE